jgi:uncharacterized membrane protein YhaH (DUF805 family)
MERVTDLYRGRLNRRSYFTGIVFCLFAFVISVEIGLFLFQFAVEVFPFLLLERVIMWIIIIALAVLKFSFNVRRLHDIGQSGWFALLLFVPFINILMVIALLFVSGENKKNAYGAKSPDAMMPLFS